MNCPHCQRLLYSRSQKKCGYCGKELPAEVLFSEAEVEKIRAEQQAINHRRALAKTKEEEEKEEAAKAAGDMPVGPMM
jgi:hypothetical protein